MVTLVFSLPGLKESNLNVYDGGIYVSESNFSVRAALAKAT